MLARILLLLLATSIALPARAQPAGEVGLLVPVPVPFKSGDAKRIVDRVNKARDAGAARPAKVVFDFNPGGLAADNTDYGECYTLAKAISGWKDINTIAFVSKPVTGHLVLPVLCCNELAVGTGAKLGQVIDGQGEGLAAEELEAYRVRVGLVRPGQYAVVRKMFDANVRLGKGKKGQGTVFVDLNDKDKFAKEGITVSDTRPILEAGSLGLFKATELEEFGFVKVKADSAADVARLYGIDLSTFRDDPLAGRAPVAVRYTLTDAITAATAETVLRSVKRAVLQSKANFVVLQLECDEGDMAAAARLAEGLIELQKANDDSSVRVVAYIPNSAKNTAVAVALGCSEIVMSKRKDQGDTVPEGTFGEFDGYLKGNGQSAEVVSRLLADLAEKQNYPVLLVRGFVERDLGIQQVRNRTNRTLTRLMTTEELAANKAEWDSVREVKAKGTLLTLKATQAQELGLVSRVLERSEWSKLCEALNLDPASVREATPGWIDQFRSFLTAPTVTTLLVIVGFIGLILELKVPGTTVPGIVAALCFVLVFWAWGINNQAAAGLAALLFIVGLILVLIEVFVLPGFGMPGIVGVLLMLGALTLVTVEKFPEQGSDWIPIGSKMATYLFALVGAAIGAFTIVRFLPNIPGASRMILPTEAERELKSPTVMPGAALAASLLGAIGVATTMLRPAGSVQFGEAFVDVVSDGDFIPAGTRVQVVEVEGTRIMVKEV